MCDSIGTQNYSNVIAQFVAHKRIYIGGNAAAAVVHYDDDGDAAAAAVAAISSLVP